MNPPLPFLRKAVPEAWNRLGDARREVAETAERAALLPGEDVFAALEWSAVLMTADNRLSVLSRHLVPGVR